ncbi:hypothetical protein JTE90_000613 [Oedothorax gibbosus]|uniref:Sex-determining region Y protein n=1 Tax=Oedothorax gibbosus TaxID=931172 RepID=A0AAV6VWR5_9ARAC|nr:hypothetical protein JTE90_000613 [Oedothorax gibbosus]
MLQTPLNKTSPEIQEDGLLKKKVDSELKPAQVSENQVLPDIQDVYPMGADSELKITKEIVPDKYADLDPGLKDLVLKPSRTKGGRVCRPPNAFMLFAKENRASIGVHNPAMTNGEKSLLLGAMWRSLANEERQKYYNDANALDKLHKETYPDYIYCPIEARKRKQAKLENRLKYKTVKKNEQRFTSPETCGDDSKDLTSKEKQSIYEIKPSSTNDVKQSDSGNNNKDDDQHGTKCHYKIKKDTNPNNPNKVVLLRLTKPKTSSENSSNECLKLDGKSKEMKLENSSQINRAGMKKDISWGTPKRPLAQRPANLLNKSTHRYMPYYKSGEQKMPNTRYSEPCIYCPYYGMDRKYAEHNHSNLRMKENITSVSSNHTYLPATRNSYFHPYQPLHNSAFYPSVFNPWMVWPGRYYNQLSYGYSNKNWMNYGPQTSSDYLNALRASVNKWKLSSTSTEYPAGVECSTACGSPLKEGPLNAPRASVNKKKLSSTATEYPAGVEFSTACGNPLKEGPLNAPRASVNKKKLSSTATEYKAGVESSTVFGGSLNDQRMTKNAVEFSTAYSKPLNIPRASVIKRKWNSTATKYLTGVESSTVFGGSLNDQRMMKNVVESSTTYGGPLEDQRTKRIHVVSSTASEAPLKNQCTKKNVVESSTVFSGPFEDQRMKKNDIESLNAFVVQLKNQHAAKNAVESSNILNDPARNAGESSNAYVVELKDQHTKKKNVESPTVLNCSFEDKRMKKKNVESLNASAVLSKVPHAIKNTVESSNNFLDVSLKDLLKNKNFVEPSSTGSFEDGSEDDEFNPLVIDID